MVSLWDVLPVVSTLDTLPACEGVAVVSFLDTLSAVSLWVWIGGRSMCCLWLLIGGLWSVPSTHCQR